MGVSERAQVEAFIGASGSGKGVSIKRRLGELAPSRLIIWDARAEYGAHAQAVSDLGALVRMAARAGDAGAIRARYVPGAGVKLAPAFELVCALAFRLGRCVFVAEELSDTTTASYAPPAWRQCTTQGRHRGLHLIGATQRPALVDKTFLANATRVRCGVLGYRADRAAMAAELDCSPELIEGLESLELEGREGGARLQMLERDRHRRTLEHVTLTVFRGGKTTETRAPVSAARYVATAGRRYRPGK